MAYAAAISLKRTIHSLQIASQSSVHPNNPSGPKILDDTYNTVNSLQQVLEKSDIRKNRTPRLHSLDRQIGRALCDLEDSFETHLWNHVLLTQSLESQPLGSTPLNLQGLEEGVRLFARSVKTMKKAYKKELNSKPLPEEDDFVCSVLGRPKKIVGFSEVLITIKDELRVKRPWHESRKVVTIVGMAGIGKTAVAKEVYEDVSGEYDCCVWVNIGPKYVYRDVMLSLLAQINPSGHDKILPEGDMKIASFLCRSLKGRRYLIILDDVWDRKVCSQLTSSFSDDKNGSRVLQTTRLHDVALFTNDHEIRLLGKEQSWELLCEKVFGDGEKCPPQLEKYRKMIAVSCEGLPLTIVTVGGMLSKAEKTLEYWKKVAEKQHSVFKDAYEMMSRILYPRYYYLPQHLKACFLYMGVFPENIKIPGSKLIKLWSAEGFLQPDTSQTVENLASRCLAGLVSNSLVINPQKSSYSSYFKEPVRIKTCALHSAFWHISTREAEKAKFLHILSSYGEGFGEDIKGQRRLSVGKSVLFGIKDVRNSMESVSTMHSLLCVGPPHMYPVPICFDRLRLLRVVDADTVRFYRFPVEVSKLVHLRYLALTCDQEIPAGTVSKLRNLESLIVGRYLFIKKSSVGAEPFLPVDIWDMKELKHLQVTGFDLPAPPCNDSLLPNLLTLSDVSIRSCTERILERIPKLKKLGIRIEWKPTVGSCCFRFEMSHLHKVESLKCVVLNPNLGCQLAARPLFDYYRTFSSHLQKLSLTGLGFPWRDMSEIGRMDNLKVLKLRCYAFRGLKWETGRDAFPMLNFLLIEDSDVVEWNVGHNSFK
ncbi:disease resistance protein [Striga asiatica]|uniref:Disease resistance protein n=1 Tax=Striga asiatica TaxID=4170 RepID=A0A5A7R664_STRAF|nr:disease resistance protein [Striga asiatica]